MLINSIHRTKIVSFPRSGHHLLVRGLQAVFESELVYSEFYKSEHNMENCPYVNVQKSHDFDLDDIVNSELKYIVLLRNREDAILSWYKQTVVYDGATVLERNFEDGKREYYDAFVDKWANNPVENSIVINYEDFIKGKLITLALIAHFISTKPLTPYQIISAKAWEKRESLGF